MVQLWLSCKSCANLDIGANTESLTVGHMSTESCLIAPKTSSMLSFLRCSLANKTSTVSIHWSNSSFWSADFATTDPSGMIMSAM